MRSQEKKRAYKNQLFSLRSLKKTREGSSIPLKKTREGGSLLFLLVARKKNSRVFRGIYFLT